MQGLITWVLILGFVSQCLCLRSNFGTKNAVYNVINYGAVGDGRSDDSLAFSKAWQSTCGTGGIVVTLVIPPRKVFLVRNLFLNGPCRATSIQIQLQGQLVAPGMGAWRGDRSYWIVMSRVNRLTIYGRGGLINGYGSTWWNCRNCQRPAVILFNACNNLVVNYLHITNSPLAHIKINACNGARFSHINIRAPASSPNTDGFDISDSTNILIEDSIIGTGDDCIAIKGDSSFINATRITCGPGHGISIGSLGRNRANEIVEEVYVQNCTFIGTLYGARIKTWPGGSGYAKRITFEQIILQRSHNPIIIDQNYPDDYPTNAAVIVNGVTYRGFQGTSADDKAINLDCSSLGCFNIIFDQNNIVSSIPGKPAYAYCKNAHGIARSTTPNVPCLLK